MDAAVDTLGYSTRKNPGWFDSNDAEIQTLLNERNAAFAAKSETPTQLNSSADGPCSVHNCKKGLREMEDTW